MRKIKGRPPWRRRHEIMCLSLTGRSRPSTHVCCSFRRRVLLAQCHGTSKEHERLKSVSCHTHQYSTYKPRTMCTEHMKCRQKENEMTLEMTVLTNKMLTNQSTSKEPQNGLGGTHCWLQQHSDPVREGCSWRKEPSTVDHNTHAAHMCTARASQRRDLSRQLIKTPALNVILHLQHNR